MQEQLLQTKRAQTNQSSDFKTEDLIWRRKATLRSVWEPGQNTEMTELFA